MNVFEDLIDELKNENLLEETVIEIPQPSRTSGPDAHDNESFSGDDAGFAFADDEALSADPLEDDGLDVLATPANDFFRKRAMDEVSSLQMVEHVFSGIEREYMKIAPAAFDDLEAKKALHRFLQLSTDPDSSECSEAEGELLRETEAWSTALFERDAAISVANLRRFCENSRPVLSSQALMALARFYRNSPYSEPARGKFDFVMSRLFSREVADAKRRTLFGRIEMIGHIKTLYANWASVSLYPAGDMDSNVQSAVAKFNEAVVAAEAAETFDQLIEADFFKKLNQFKESTSEMFFAPDVTAAAIDCNVRIGNKFVELILASSETTGIEGVEAKYGYSYDQILSLAAARTLRLVDVLRNGDEDSKGFDADQFDDDAALNIKPTPKAETVSSALSASSLFRVNKWLLATTVLILAISVGAYLWADKVENEQSSVPTARTIDLSSSDLSQHLRTARATESTLYAITLPSWDTLTEAQQKEFLQKVLQFAGNYKLQRVELMNLKGRTVGFASKDRTDILPQ
jgi:hypothetical protein